MRKPLTLALAALLSAAVLPFNASAGSWIRINQLGYLPDATKVAVFMTDESLAPESFRLVDAFTGETALTGGKTPDGTLSDVKMKDTGPMGQMKATCRLDFSAMVSEGAYYIEVTSSTQDGAAVTTKSEIFPVNTRVYDGAADFVLNYMRQQR